MEAKLAFRLRIGWPPFVTTAKIMVINGGEIEEYAPHDELMAARGF